jgi:hypothetical protein
LLSLQFNPEDGDDMFLRNARWINWRYTQEDIIHLLDLWSSRKVRDCVPILYKVNVWKRRRYCTQYYMLRGFCPSSDILMQDIHWTLKWK